MYNIDKILKMTGINKTGDLLFADVFLFITLRINDILMMKLCFIVNRKSNELLERLIKDIKRRQVKCVKAGSLKYQNPSAFDMLPEE